MLLKGRPAADALVARLADAQPPSLRLAVFHPAGDASAESYLRAKEKTLARLNFSLEVIPFDAQIAPEEFFARLDTLNRDRTVHGIMVETPFPATAPADEIYRRIDPRKDVDGLSFINQGLLYATRREVLVPCTAMGAVVLLEHYGVELAGRAALVIGRSATVGMPLAKLLLNRNATVTVAHSRTPGLGALAGRHDIVAAAAGKEGLLRSVDVRDGAAVVDIGINVAADGCLCGDFVPTGPEEAERIHYSPVPGGAGAVTNAVLLMNLVTCHNLQQEK